MRGFFVMEEHLVYIMYSEKSDVFYKGYTTDLIQRFKSHNELATKGYTLKHRPWKVVHVEFFDSEKEAKKRETFFKSGIGRKWIRKNFG
ncbi:GIY-YIG nuclease family protein [Allomuricauda sp. d1]|uniref:GIY-YIG nuclease family protein n=1 Tax=Allomuricauda sp. d1 TaxID=3136725 RepID=UPI0031CF788D